MSLLARAFADNDERDAAVEDERLRIWIGVVPPKMPRGVATDAGHHRRSDLVTPR